MLTACTSTDEPAVNSNEQPSVSSEEESHASNISSWKYYSEMPSVPTPDSCIDGIIFVTSFEEDGNNVYGYYVSDDSTIANEKYDSYLKILEDSCGFQFIKKPNMAIARENGESLFGVGITDTDEGNYVMDVLFIGNNSGIPSSNNTVDTPSSRSDSSSKTQATTMGEKQALKKALQYLDYTAFSYSGLVDQLEYEGFSHSEAIYGADNCGADWNEQAAKKAQEYLDFTSFSRQELISQLEYEGFTHQQAEYGVTAVGY